MYKAHTHVYVCVCKFANQTTLILCKSLRLDLLPHYLIPVYNNNNNNIQNAHDAHATTSSSIRLNLLLLLPSMYGLKPMQDVHDRNYTLTF